MKRRGHSDTGKGAYRGGYGDDHHTPHPPGIRQGEKLDLVLKSDSMGSAEAVIATLERMEIPGVELNIISSGVGFVSKSDLLMAVTGSRIVLGFQTDAMPEVEQECRRHGIEVRLYDVIFKMAQDVAEIGGSLLPPEREEKITGKGTVIALFKSTRKGTILGCRVIDGVFAEGDRFRVVSPMGVTYTGKVESLHIGKNAVKMAKTGQEVGLKISDFKKARVGDQVECFETPQARATESWRPRAGVFRI